jgi:hypothetical protein
MSLEHNRRMRRAGLRAVAALLLALMETAMVASAARGELVDRIVAAVGGSVMTGAAAAGTSFVASGAGASGGSGAGATVITWSGVFDEANYQAFRQNREPVRWKPTDPVSAPAFRDVLQKMIDQMLLEQELERSPFAPAGGSDVQDQLEMVEKKFPDAEAYHSALARYHLTQDELAERLTRESILLAFVDSTLRPQVHVTDEQIENYYQTTLLPELRQRSGASATVPSLEDVRAQIEELLIQPQLDSLLEQWLQQLRHGAQIEIWPE